MTLTSGGVCENRSRVSQSSWALIAHKTLFDPAAAA
jgi:hypothetical protein